MGQSWSGVLSVLPCLFDRLLLHGFAVTRGGEGRPDTFARLHARLG